MTSHRMIQVSLACSMISLVLSMLTAVMRAKDLTDCVVIGLLLAVIAVAAYILYKTFPRE